MNREAEVYAHSMFPQARDGGDSNNRYYRELVRDAFKAGYEARTNEEKQAYGESVKNVQEETV